MGIKGLKKTINECMKSMTWDDFRGITLAIDSMIFLYRCKGTKYLETEEESTQILFGFINLVMFLKEYDITPFFIFDGKPPDEKKAVLEERKEKRKEALSEYDVLIKAIENKKKIKVKELDSGETRIATEKEIRDRLDELRRASLKVKFDEITLVKKFLEFMGIPYHNAPGEAEWFCAKLNQMGIVDACLSEDTDLLPYGATTWILDYKPFNKNIKVFYQTDVINYLNNRINTERQKRYRKSDLIDFNFNHFIDLCIMMGCDNLPKLPFIGPIKALGMIAEHINIEEILKYIPERNFPKEFRENPDKWNYQRARDLFSMLIDDYQKMKVNEALNKIFPKNDELLEFFDEHCEANNVSTKQKERMRNHLINYCKKYGQVISYSTDFSHSYDSEYSGD